VRAGWETFKEQVCIHHTAEQIELSSHSILPADS
jgi:hypothetical protein